MVYTKTKTVTGFLFAGVLLICLGCGRKVTVESLLREMSDREYLTRFPGKEYTLRQASSYNRESVAAGEKAWYANADMSYFVRVENNGNRREFVLLDQEGPGAIVRWWMTFWKAENGILRVYLDHEPVPEIEGPPFRVISGQMLAPAPFSQSVPPEAPLNERGHNLYVPIPFAKHCKITYECDSLREKDQHWYPDVFYNICYRQYKAGTRVETFRVKKLKKELFDHAGQILLAGFPSGKRTEQFDRKIMPGDTLLFSFNEKGMALSYLNLDLTGPDIRQALRSTVLSAAFDGQQTVWVPAGEFFGTGYQLFPHRTWVNRTSDDRQMESAWVMPFRETCTLSYINCGKDTIRVKGAIGLSDYTWNPRSMYFGACWHEYRHLSTRNEKGWFFDLNYVDIQGKGLYVGDQVTLFNTANTWWGEGDEKIFVDGEAFPSSFGTGSEDYYGYAFGHPEPFSHPFISQPSGAGNFVPGMTVNMRHRSLDAIPFNSSISSNIEMWHWASATINYALSAFWYVQTPFELNIHPDITEVQFPVATSKNDFIKNDQNDPD